MIEALIAVICISLATALSYVLGKRSAQNDTIQKNADVLKRQNNAIKNTPRGKSAVIKRMRNKSF